MSITALSEKQIGDYILSTEIGSGGFAKVVQAKHIPTGENVAVKVLDKLQLMENPEDFERIEREIQILKLVKHKNIIKLYEVVETPQKIYIVMELCEEGELFDYIVSKGRLNENEACVFFQEIVNAIDYLHSQNIVHRDIKPENMLLTKHKGKPTIKLIDFGISRPYLNDTLLSTPCGTASYAAPEMHKGEEYYGLLTDVYSCGIVLYSMVYGYLPFCEDDENENVNNIIKGDYLLENDVSESVRDLIMNCLKTNPVERYDLEQIKQHPWFNSVTPLLLRPGIIVGYNTIPIDDNVLKKCEEFGYDTEEVKTNVQCNNYNRNSAIYYIILKKMVTEGYESVSDLISDGFVEFIKEEIVRKEKEEIIPVVVVDKDNNNNNELVAPVLDVKDNIDYDSSMYEDVNVDDNVKEGTVLPGVNSERNSMKNSLLIINKFAGRKSLSLHSQLHLTLLNDFNSNKSRKGMSIFSKQLEDSNKDDILPQTNNVPLPMPMPVISHFLNEDNNNQSKKTTSYNHDNTDDNNDNTNNDNDTCILPKPIPIPIEQEEPQMKILPQPEPEPKLQIDDVIVNNDNNNNNNNNDINKQSISTPKIKSPTEIQLPNIPSGYLLNTNKLELQSADKEQETKEEKENINEIPNTQPQNTNVNDIPPINLNNLPTNTNKETLPHNEPKHNKQRNTKTKDNSQHKNKIHQNLKLKIPKPLPTNEKDKSKHKQTKYSTLPNQQQHNHPKRSHIQTSSSSSHTKPLHQINSSRSTNTKQTHQKKPLRLNQHPSPHPHIQQTSQSIKHKKDHTIIHNRNASAINPSTKAENVSKHKIINYSYSMEKITKPYTKYNKKFPKPKKQIQTQLEIETYKELKKKNDNYRRNKRINKAINNSTLHESHKNILTTSIRKNLNRSFGGINEEKLRVLSQPKKIIEIDETQYINKAPKKPLSKIQSYIATNLYSPHKHNKKGKPAIPTLLRQRKLSDLSEQNQVSARRSKKSHKKEIRELTCPNNNNIKPRVYNGPVDVKCISCKPLQVICEHMMKYFKKYKIGILKLGVFKYHCSKNGVSFDCEICKLNNSENEQRDVYCLLIRNKQGEVGNNNVVNIENLVMDN